jgi:hypothetical protein
MVERPILFNAEMVRAILDGRKTQTRRVMKPQPETYNGKPVQDQGRLHNSGWLYDGQFFIDDGQMMDHLFHEVYGRKGSPYGGVYADGTADSLWVRETHTWITLADSDPWREQATADGCLKRHPDGYDVAMIYRADGDEIGSNWRPSIFMPRWASRITLDLVDVRVERLQDISEGDAIAEGVAHNLLGDDCPPKYQNEWQNYLAATDDDPPCYSAVDSFRTLWDSINSKRGYGWAANPWVWVVEFKPHPPQAEPRQAALFY